MLKFKGLSICLLLAALLSACNLGQSGIVATAVIEPTPTQAVFIKTAPPSSPTSPPLPTSSALPTSKPVQAATPTFPPVITATPLPVTATVPPSATAIKATGLKITEINMLNTTTGWAVGQALPAKDQLVLRTTDGGKNWKKVTPPEPALAGKTAVAFFLDSTKAWVSYALPISSPAPGQFTVWRTTDGGASWKSTATNLSGLTMEHFTTVQLAFQDASNGWMMSLLGAGMNHTYFAIYKTSDAGATWKQIVSLDKNNAPMSCSKNAAWFRDSAHGFIAGSCNGVQKGLYLYRSSDSGSTWGLVDLPAPPGLADAFTRDTNVCSATALRFFDDKKGYLTVSCTDMNANKSYRWIYTTKDGGTNWSASTLPRQFGDITFLNADTGWFLGQTAADNYGSVNVYKTTDAGKNWAKISGTNWGGLIDFIDAKNGWAIARSANDIALVRSADGGLTYQVITPQLIP